MIEITTVIGNDCIKIVFEITIKLRKYCYPWDNGQKRLFQMSNKERIGYDKIGFKAGVLCQSLKDNYLRTGLHQCTTIIMNLGRHIGRCPVTAFALKGIN